MSYGRKSPLFAPIDREKIDVLKDFYPDEEDLIEEMFVIMTDRLVTETLLFVALVDQVSRYRHHRFDRRFPGIRSVTLALSAIRTDGTPGKMQSPIMELLHDVVVELQMAGRNFRMLQKCLGKCGLAITFFHSCGDIVASVDDIEALEEACATEQFTRTTLDWTAGTTKGISVERLLAATNYTREEADAAARIERVAIALINVRRLVAVA